MTYPYLPRITALAGGIAMAMVVSNANAETTFTPYLSVFAGFGSTENADFSGTVTPPGGQQTVATKFDDGFNVGGAIGFEIDNSAWSSVSPRVELELSYLSSDADEIDFSGNGAGVENNTSGDFSRTLLLANVLLDFKTSTSVMPYLGVGLGAAFANTDIRYGGPVGGAAPVFLDDSDVRFASQLIAGASYKVNSNVSLFIDGRYTRVFDFKTNRFNPGGLTGRVSDNINNFSANLGLRYEF